MVMLQEAKFKSYFDELTFILHEYGNITAKILPATAKLLEPLVRDVELKLVRPAAVLHVVFIMRLFCASHCDLWWWWWWWGVGWWWR